MSGMCSVLWLPFPCCYQKLHETFTTSEHGIWSTTNPEPSEGLVAEGKGIPATMPIPEPAMLMQLHLPPSPPLHVTLVPL